MIIQNIILMLLNIIDAVYNLYIINGANPSDIVDNRKWHKWGGWFALGIAFYIGYYVNPYYGGLYLVYRASVFAMALNLLRGKPLFYLSVNGFEGWFTKHNLQWLYFLGCFIFAIILNILLCHRHIQ
jgi:hypothetical protein